MTPTSLSSHAARTDGPRGRTYTLPDGSTVPSVTTILQVIGKPALIAWAANVERELVVEAAANLYEDAPAHPKMSRPAYITTLQDRLGKERAHQKKLDRAADLGSQVHKLCEWNLRQELGQKQGPAPHLEPDAASAFEQYEAWRGTVTLTPKRMEQMVWHPGERYAGTLDVLCELDGMPTILDFKTSKGLYLEHEIQVAAYAFALYAMGHGMVSQAVIVKLPKQTGQSFEVRTLDMRTLADRFDAFMEAFRLWKHMRAWEKERGCSTADAGAGRIGSTADPARSAESGRTDADRTQEAETSAD